MIVALQGKPGQREEPFYRRKVGMRRILRERMGGSPEKTARVGLAVF